MPNVGIVEHDGIHAYQYMVFKRGSMNDSPVAHNTVGPNGARITWVGMQYGVILDVAAITHLYLIGISPEHSSKPNGHLLAQVDAPNGCRIGR
jgi:hypothetical protein